MGVIIPMTPSVGIIIYQSRLKIHRPLWCWLGWGLEGWRMNPWCAGRLTSAAKADSENKPVIAAVNRCATQNQVRHRSFPQPVKPMVWMALTARLKPRPTRSCAQIVVGWPKTGQAPSLHEFSAACEAAPLQNKVKIPSGRQSWNPTLHKTKGGAPRRLKPGPFFSGLAVCL